MTAPRQVLPDHTYLVSRRCLGRQFLLRPAKWLNRLFLYLVAVAAARCGIQVHVLCVMSNHFHMVVTDPQARLPEFHQFLDSLVARAVNAMIGRSETFWAPNSYSAIPLTTAEDILDKAAYVLANPAAAGLVRTGREWPGLWTAPERVGGKPYEVRRPRHFFDPDGGQPEKATLQLTVPPGFASADDFREQLREALAVREALAAEQCGGRFLGAAGVLAQKRTQAPVSVEPIGRLKPRVAAKDKWKRREAIHRLKDFLARYRDAWEAWRSGRRAVFPAGTYQLRVTCGVQCEGFG